MNSMKEQDHNKKKKKKTRMLNSGENSDTDEDK